jgi:hypothetical protein
MFSTGILIAGGSSLLIALLDKFAEDCGIQWINTTLKILIPLIAMIVSVYFLETNSLLRWLK